MVGVTFGILTDSIAFENAHQRGVQRSFVQLWRAMRTVQPNVALNMVASHRVQRVPENVNMIREPLWHRMVPSRTWRRGAQARWRQATLDTFASTSSVFHSTYFGSAPAGVPTCPVVVTVHDMIPEEFPDQSDAVWRAREVLMKHRAMQQAHVLLAVSNATAEAVSRVYPDLAAKVRVVHHGADHVKTVAVGEFPRQNALFVGDRAGYKNFSVVAHAMAERSWPDDIALRVVGKPWTSEEMEMIERLGLSSRIHHLGRLSDDELVMAYATSRLLVSASLAEGFGFPVVEAQRQSVAVVCSRTTINQEVAGGAAAFFEPLESASLAAAVASLQNQFALESLIQSGHDNVKRFTWTNCALRTLAVYEEAMQLVR